jgi:hypothetical protein
MKHLITLVRARLCGLIESASGGAMALHALCDAKPVHHRRRTFTDEPPGITQVFVS